MPIKNKIFVNASSLKKALCSTLYGSSFGTIFWTIFKLQPNGLELENGSENGVEARTLKDSTWQIFLESTVCAGMPLI